ncbi:hypothetical protein H6P81_008227 [Aristolochia fimbriata]|uniref:S-adenosyl-L-methionine-dependent methyltransferase n=1 Tax=Aristolochia fimbriata TaxID=158543 RepID=A0AAV7F2R9_ARIFI|nr:hypothetical protein H6P81_008227 [Aristolochia fimbriata]
MMTASLTATSYSLGFSLVSFSHACSNPAASRNSASIYKFHRLPQTHLRVTANCDGGKSVSPSLPPVRALQDSATANEKGNDDEELSVLIAMRSQYNDIVIVDSPKARYLLLDSTHNVHSIYNKAEKWTGSYWDEFASLPAIIPNGPVALLGLGGGTAAHLLLELWPSLQLEGWEIDKILVDQAREYLGLSDLEKHNQDGGVLNIHVGDAFSPSAVVPGGFAGIVVDLFSDGEVLSHLQEVETWLELGKRLMANGRIMVNCGGAHPEKSNIGDGNLCEGDNVWLQNSTIRTMIKAFPGKLNWKRLSEKDSVNYMALTGTMPDLNEWANLLPHRLRSNLDQWRPCKFG